MAAELGLLSLNQLQKLAQSQQNQHQPTAASSWMWNPKAQNLEDDDSWEVRAFAEDTGNIMGTTWPPRSYTCTFCRREFRSAQALGGHMNVHRRDRARLHQTQPGGGAAAVAVNPTTSSSSSSTLFFPTQEFTANGGLCLLYQLPNPDGVFTASPPITACPIDSPSTLLSISSPYPSKNLMATQSINFPATHPPGTNNSPSFCYSTKAEPSSFCYSTKAEPSTTMFTDNIGSNNNNNNSSSNNCKESSFEELDLELRLGHRPTTS